MFREHGLFDAAARLSRFRGFRAVAPKCAFDHEQILDAEDFNRTHFEAGTFVAGSGRRDIDCPLLTLGDGRIHDFADFIERPLPDLDQPFRYIGVRSNGGFTARRTGKKLLIDGTIRHGFYTTRRNAASMMERAGKAHAFPTHYRHRQDVSAESWYVPEGMLTLTQVTWGDLY